MRNKNISCYLRQVYPSTGLLSCQSPTLIQHLAEWSLVLLPAKQEQPSPQGMMAQLALCYGIRSFSFERVLCFHK